jgi:hypothetical protein
MPGASEFDPIPVLVRFADAAIDFVVIGGVAGGAHGSIYATEDVDLAYSRETANLERLAALLRELDAHLRVAPRDVPFQLNAQALEAGGNFTFETSLGDIDILAYPAGAPAYEQLKRDAKLISAEGRQVWVASLDHLIAMKEAAGRAKDLLAASEYRAIADELNRRGTP